MNAIQQGILTKSTKGRLEELEATKEELETKIACEKLAKPKVSAEFMTFWLHRFRKLDVRQKSHRKMLIDTFINAIFLYDDKMVITFNYKEGTTTITFDDLKTALADQKTGSDLDCSTAPKSTATSVAVFFYAPSPSGRAHASRKRLHSPRGDRSLKTFHWNVFLTLPLMVHQKQPYTVCRAVFLFATSRDATTFPVQTGTRTARARRCSGGHKIERGSCGA